MPKFKFENGKWFFWTGTEYVAVEGAAAQRLVGYTSFAGVPGIFKGAGKPDLPALNLFDAQFADLGDAEIVPGGERTVPLDPKPFMLFGGRWNFYTDAERYEELDKPTQTVLTGYTDTRQEGDQTIFTGPGKQPLSQTAVGIRAEQVAQDEAAATAVAGEVAPSAFTVTPLLDPEGNPTGQGVWIDDLGVPHMVSLPDARDDTPVGQQIELPGTDRVLVSLGGGRWQVVPKTQAEDDPTFPELVGEAMEEAFKAGDFDEVRRLQRLLNDPKTLQELTVRALTNPNLTPEQQRAEAQRLFNFANQPTVQETTRLLLEIAQSPGDIFALSALMGGANISQGFIGGLPRDPFLEETARALLGDAWADFVQAGFNTGGLDRVDDATMDEIASVETLPEQEEREKAEIEQTQALAPAPAPTPAPALAPADPEEDPEAFAGGGGRPSLGIDPFQQTGGSPESDPDAFLSSAPSPSSGGGQTKRKGALANPFQTEIDDALDEAQIAARIIERRRKVSQNISGRQFRGGL